MSQTTSLRPRTLPASFVRYIRLEDEWALFSLQIVPNADQTSAWAYVSHLADLTGKRDGLIRLIQEWRRLERWCFHDGILGWYCVTAKDNTRFIRWLLAIGAEAIKETERGIQFQKLILRDPVDSWSKLTSKDLATSIHHGRAGHA